VTHVRVLECFSHAMSFGSCNLHNSMSSVSPSSAVLRNEDDVAKGRSYVLRWLKSRIIELHIMLECGEEVPGEETCGPFLVDATGRMWTVRNN